MTDHLDRQGAEARFKGVFSHLGAVTAYARRRGARDADALAAEVMTIAWRRLSDVPVDDPRPWLYATARNLLLAEARHSAPAAGGGAGLPASVADAPEVHELDPPLERALRSLSRLDREALLLIAWEDLTPTQAARSLSINPAAFRVRLLRARRRLRAKLNEELSGRQLDPNAHLDMETT
ncbi:MAG TPA: sigma-70 family RNA polymerase sigma factor [Gaiellaceae bacterium]